MPLELRPTWCLTDAVVEDVLALGPWIDDHGRTTAERDGDDWKPGDAVLLTRSVELLADPIEVRRRLGLRAGAIAGIAARWSCRSTASAGVHVGGPAPLDLIGGVSIEVGIPDSIGGSVELETCLVVRWPSSSRPATSCPDRALVWSDGWTRSASERELLLEGAQGRIPVRTASFKSLFGSPSGALWAVEVEPAIEAEDYLSNVVTIVLNEDVLERDFPGLDGAPEMTRLPPSALSGMQVDLVRSLTAALHEEMNEESDWTAYRVGTVGSMLALRLTEAFGSTGRAATTFEQDQSSFSRELWNRFAPNSWNAER